MQLHQRYSVRYKLTITDRLETSCSVNRQGVISKQCYLCGNRQDSVSMMQWSVHGLAIQFVTN